MVRPPCRAVVFCVFFPPSSPLEVLRLKVGETVHRKGGGPWIQIFDRPPLSLTKGPHDGGGAPIAAAAEQAVDRHQHPACPAGGACQPWPPPRVAPPPLLAAAPFLTHAPPLPPPCATAQRAASSVGQPLRASNPGLRATIFGAYGFVGRYVTAMLGACKFGSRRSAHTAPTALAPRSAPLCARRAPSLTPFSPLRSRWFFSSPPLRSQPPAACSASSPGAGTIWSGGT